MGANSSKREELSISSKLMLVLFIHHAIAEVDNDIQETDEMFRRLLAGLNMVYMRGTRPEHIRRPGTAGGSTVDNLTVRGMMYDVASLDIAEKDEKGIG